MSVNIDERVVQMKFDNKQFESGVSTTLSTLDKLKSKLNMDGATKGLTNIGQVASSISFNALEAGVNTVGGKFSVMEQIAIGALRNIGAKIESTASQLVKSFTIDPVKTGFNEFELKMGSVQTIMAGTGESLETVNQYLDELNKYSDQTIYSFQDMTSNIGKFTNAGVKLEDAVAAIKGISNEAAVSGANANEASRAMYNFSQALSAGFVKLIDWKSIENANMATVEFKNQLIETAVEVGTLKKGTDGLYNVVKIMSNSAANTLNATHNFNDSLANQWMTTEVLTQTLAKYADETTEIGRKASQAATEVKTYSMMMDTLREAAQSGWAQTWETIVGDFNQGKALWTGLSDTFSAIIDRSASARNDFLTEAFDSNYDKFMAKVQDAGFTIEEFEEIVLNSNQDVAGILVNLEDKYGSMTEVLKNSKHSADWFIKTLEDIDDWEKRLQKLKEKGEDVSIGEEQLANVKKLAKDPDVRALLSGNLQQKSGRDLLSESLKNIIRLFDEVLQVFDRVQSKFNTFKPMTLYRFLERFADFTGTLRLFEKDTKKLNETGKKFETVLKGIFSAASIIKNVLSGLYTAVIKPLIPYILDGTSEVSDKILTISDYLQELNEKIKNTKLFEDIGEKFSNALVDISAFIENAKKKIVEFKDKFSEDFDVSPLEAIKGIFEKVTEAITNAITNVDEFKQKVIKYVDEIDEKFKNSAFLNFLTTIKDAVIQVVTYIGDTIKNLLSELDFSNLDLSGIGSLLLGGGLIYGIKALIELLMDAKDAIKDGTFAQKIKDGTAVIKLALENLKEPVEAFTKNQYAEALFNIAKAVATLAGSLVLVAAIPDDKLANSVASLIVLFFALNSFSSKINKVKELKNLPSIIVMINGISSAVVLLSYALTNIAKAEPDKLLGAIVSINLLCQILTRTMEQMSEIDSSGIIESCGQMILVALAIDILSDAVKRIGSMELTEVAKGVGAVVTLIYTLIWAMEKMSKIDSKNAIKGCGQMILLAAAIDLLSIAVVAIGSMGLAEVSKGVGAVVTLVASMVAAMILLSKYVDDDMALKLTAVASAMTIMAKAIDILAVSVVALGVLKLGDITQGLIAVTSLIYVVSEAMISLSENVDSVGKLMGAVIAMNLMAVAIAALSVPILILGKMDFKDFAQGFTSVLVLITGLTKAMLMLSENTGSIKDMMAGVVAMNLAAIAVGILSGSLYLIGKIDSTTLADSAMVLGSMIITLALALNKMKDTMSGSQALIVAAAAIGVIAVSFKLLSTMKPLELVAVLGVMAGALITIGVAGKILSKIAPQMMTASKALLVFSGSVIAVGAGIAALGAGILVFGMGLTTVAAGLTAFVLAVESAGSKVLNNLSAIGVGLTKTISTLLTAIANSLEQSGDAILRILRAVLTTVLQAFLEFIPQLVTSFLELIGETLAGLVEHAPEIVDQVLTFIIAILDKVAERVPELITSITNLISAIIGSVIENIKSFDSSTVVENISTIGLIAGLLGAMAGLSLIAGPAAIGIAEFAGLVTELTIVLAALGALNQIPGLNWIVGEGGEILNTIADVLGGFIGHVVGSLVGGAVEAFTESLPSIGTSLSEFMSNVAPFIEGANSINPNMMDGVNALADTVLTLTKADIINGITSWLTGGNSLEDFGKSLVPFGESMKAYSDSIDGLNAETVSASANAALALAELVDNIPNSGGWIAKITGDNSLADLAKGLVPFGLSLKLYSDAVTGIDADSVKMSAEAGKALANLAEKIPNTGGLIAKISGDNDMGTFGTQLVKMGAALKLYSISVTGIKTESIEASKTATEILINLANELPKSGGLSGIISDFFSGSNSFETFSSQFKNFGLMLKEYSDIVSGINSKAVTSSTEAVRGLVAIANLIPNTGGLITFFSGDNGIDTFGPKLISFGTALDEFFKSILEVSGEKIGEVANGLRNLFALTSMDSSGFASLGKNLKIAAQSGIKDFTESFVEGLKNTIVQIKIFYPQFYTTGSEISTKLDNGVASKINTIKTTMIKLIESALTAMRSKYQNFYKVGEYLVLGFVDGMEDNIQKAADAAAKMANAAADAAAKALDEHSPSKVGYKIGDFFGVGFVNAISDNYNNAFDAGVNIANEAKAGLTKAVTKIAAFIDNNIDPNPTITPVLDTSLLEQGVKGLSTMFGYNQVAGISASFSNRKEASSQDLQNGSNTKNGTTYTFTQNNYSPKALSRSEIYRQTRNQFTAMKEAIQ